MKRKDPLLSVMVPAHNNPERKLADGHCARAQASLKGPTLCDPTNGKS